MNTNVGVQDKLIRLLIGAFCIFLGMSDGYGSMLSIISGIVGLILVATGVMSFCPLYKIFRLNTCQKAVI